MATSSAMATTSAYELQVAENIRKNNEFLLSLGIQNPVEKKNKVVRKPKQPVAVEETSRSSRSQGPIWDEPEAHGTAQAGTDLSIAAQQPANTRDPLACWWTATEEDPDGQQRPALTDEQQHALETELTAEQRATLVLPVGEGGDQHAWVTDFLQFIRAYGGKVPEPYCVPSVANFRKFFDSISNLAAGTGITCSYRGGVFDEGIPHTPLEDIDDIIVRAKKWLPDAKDKSNGWVWKHPLTKLKLYQRALFSRDLFPFVWSDVQPTPPAEAEADDEQMPAAFEVDVAGSAADAMAIADAEAGHSVSPCAGVTDPTGEAIAWDEEPAADRTENQQSPGASSSVATAPAATDDDDEDVDEVAPLSKRLKTARAASTTEAVPVSTMPVFKEGDKIRSAPGRPHRHAKWFTGFIEEVNVDDNGQFLGTYDLVYDDGDDEAGVREEFIKSV